nr:SpoIIE family protein phosphatase [uncultured Ruminococcus sp.]
MKNTYPNTGKRWLSLMLALLMIAAAFTAVTAVQSTLKAEAAETGNNNFPAFDPLAPGASYSCILYNYANGLPTSEANAITQTSDGFIWIGSYGGLVRYDGNSFERMDSSLGISSVICLLADRRDRLWFGSNDSGLAMLYRDEVMHWGLDEGLRSLSICCFVEDPKGTIYVGTKDGVYTINEDLQLTHIDDERIDDVYIGDMKIGSDGLIYCISQAKDMFTLKDGKVVKYFPNDVVPVENVSCILPSKIYPGYVYLGSDNGGVYHCDFRETPRIAKSFTDEVLAAPNSMNYIDGRIWVCATDKIAVIEGAKVKVLENSPMNNAIYKVMEDYEGNLWFASTRQGVMEITPNRFTDIYEQYQLPSDVVNATGIYDNKLFIGTDLGLNIIDQNGVYDKLELKEPFKLNGSSDTYTDLKKVFEGHRIRSIITDSKDRLWMAVWTGLGVFCYDHGKLTQYTQDNGMISNKARRVVEFSDGSIAVATGDGVSVIKDDKVVKNYGRDDGLENPIILTVAEGFDGDILAGSDGAGIYVIKDGETKVLTLDNGLTSDTILLMKRDHKRDIIWVISSNSIGYFEPGYKFTHVKNFPYSNNFDFVQNSKDEMWVLNSNGIYVVPTDDMLKNEDINVTRYTISNGLSCTSTANSNSVVTDKGELYMAGNAGVIRLNIESGSDEEVAYKASVPFIDVNDKRQYPDENGNFTIPSDTKTLTINGFVYNYSLMTPMVSYRLEGFSDETTTVSSSDFDPVVYTNLRGGNYSFVMTVSDPLSDTEKTVTVKIRKEKAFYETIWFYLLAGLFVLMIGVVSARIFFSKKLEKMQKKHKEEVEKERLATELKTANKIQADMLPRIFPDRKEFRLFASMDPAKEVGGDFYDFFMTDENHLAMVMADVSGKGIPAAMFMVVAKTLIKNRALMGGGPGEILEYVNNQLCENNEEDLFVTVWMAIIDIRTGKGLAANAGHEHPAISRNGGKYELSVYRHSPAVATMEGLPFREHPFELHPGDNLFVYTDGVAEATDSNNELFGPERMLNALNRDPQADPEKLLQIVRAEIDEFVGEADQFDDITMMSFHFNGDSEEQGEKPAEEQ